MQIPISLKYCSLLQQFYLLKKNSCSAWKKRVKMFPLLALQLLAQGKGESCFIQMYEAEKLNIINKFYSHSLLHISLEKKAVLSLPLSDGGIQPLPVGGWNSVVVVEVLLVVLLDSSCVSVGWFLSGKNISSHLLLLFGLQSNDFIANWR